MMSEAVCIWVLGSLRGDFTAPFSYLGSCEGDLYKFQQQVLLPLK